MQIHANKTEDFFANKSLDDLLFQGALKVLNEELCPEEHLLNPNSNYLSTVAQGLLYKVRIYFNCMLGILPSFFAFQYFLTVMGEKVAPALRSGALNLVRDLTIGKQEYETDPKEWPVNQPTIKVEARAQCSGALFVNLFVSIIKIVNIYLCNRRGKVYR